MRLIFSSTAPAIPASRDPTIVLPLAVSTKSLSAKDRTLTKQSANGFGAETPLRIGRRTYLELAVKSFFNVIYVDLIVLIAIARKLMSNVQGSTLNLARSSEVIKS
jgi:hypothetical protein